MSWFQNFNVTDIQLDIVGFLAILGEGSVLSKSSVSNLSKWNLLPRIMPAPQALMRPTRPLELQSSPGTVIGVVSGTRKDSINHVGSLVCGLHKLPPHSVSCLEIRRISQDQVSVNAVGAYVIVVFVGFTLSVLLSVLSVWLRDGMSIVAVTVLSFLSSLIGYMNHGTLDLRRPRLRANIPNDDVVIRYPAGSFLVVRCNEDIARELFFAPNEFKYTLSSSVTYRLLCLLGTMMLMGGVICLANAKIELQIAWALAYAVIGAIYWVTAALPDTLFWDTSCYSVTPEAILNPQLNNLDYFTQGKSYTDALWKAIALTQNADWVWRDNACPETEAWRNWVFVAELVGQKTRLLEEGGIPGVKTWQLPYWEPSDCFRELLTGGTKEQAIKDAQRLNEGAQRTNEETQRVNGKWGEPALKDEYPEVPAYEKIPIYGGVPDYEEFTPEVPATQDAATNAVNTSKIREIATGVAPPLWRQFFEPFRRLARPSVCRGFRRIEWTCH